VRWRPPTATRATVEEQEVRVVVPGRWTCHGHVDC